MPVTRPACAEVSLCLPVISFDSSLCEVVCRNEAGIEPREHFPAQWNPIHVKKMLTINSLRAFCSQNPYPLLRNTR
jgi:hypothetical protein